MQLKIEYIPLSAITPYKRNAKKHPASQIEQIKNSITQFGMNDPIAIWGSNNEIVEGHGRVIACKELGIDTVPVIRLDSLSDEQRKAYCLVHNKLTLNSDFDLNILALELSDITIDMDGYGFFAKELDEEIDDIGDIEDDSGFGSEFNGYSNHHISCPHCGAIITLDSKFNIVE